MPYIQEIWSRDPFTRLELWLRQMCDRHARTIGFARIGDAIEEAARLTGDELVIVDPPYSAVQYSRFYHVLETVASCERQVVTGAGRYPPPPARPSSRFSLRTESLGAMCELLDSLAENGCRVLITFPAGESSNGLSGARIVELARERFCVSCKTVLGRFSTLGGNNSLRASRQTSAELIVALTPL
jgi:hypothetical protein